MSDEIPIWRDINTVRLRGRLGRDPEFRTLANGGDVMSLRVATSEKWTDKKSGEKRERTEWHSISSFAEQHINAARQMKKGDRIELIGALQTREWTAPDGNKRYATEIVLGRWGASLVLVPEEERADAPRAERKPQVEPADIDDEIPF